ncbi:MAG: HAMP domain-containing histidine kinase [Ktedonobacterales bacterium]|nr:HAMP domain-containing histidine kinase [Ktedonobacterales bacterium]
MRRQLFRWRHTLRWRLALTYVVVLAVLLAVLGLALNIFIGRIILQTDFDAFWNDVRSGIATNQRNFDAQVRACATPPNSYQQAFQDAIAKPLTASHAGIQAVYLLDHAANVLTPTSDAVPLQSSGPYLLTNQVLLLREAVRTAPRGTGTGYIADVHYMTTDAQGQRIGVELAATHYYAASRCASPSAHAAVGIVEVITTFPRYQAVMMRVRFLLVIAFLAVLGIGLLIGVPLTAAALRPLSRMTATARSIAWGDLSQRMRLPHGGDEIGQLADTFDEMIERIDRAFAAQLASEDRMRQFIADASHELRTPLTAIRGGIDVLLHGAKSDPATVDQVLLTTQRESERMSRLLGDLLTLARLDVSPPMELRPIDIITLAGEAVDQARLMAGERQVILETDHQGRLIVNAESDRLKQVLIILLDNALKYGRQGADGWVRVYVARAERGAVVRVSDNGQGISEEDLPRIFDRFYRADRAARQRRLTAPRAGASPSGATDAANDLVGVPASPRRTPPPTGSGLGLAIAWKIIQAHGGTLRVESQFGVGTTFTIALPLGDTSWPSRAS